MYHKMNRIYFIDKIYEEILKLRGIPEWMRLNPLLEEGINHISDKYFGEPNDEKTRSLLMDDLRSIFGKNLQINYIATHENSLKGRVTFSISDGNRSRNITLY